MCFQFLKLSGTEIVNFMTHKCTVQECWTFNNAHCVSGFELHSMFSLRLIDDVLLVKSLAFVHYLLKWFQNGKRWTFCRCIMNGTFKKNSSVTEWRTLNVMYEKSFRWKVFNCFSMKKFMESLSTSILWTDYWQADIDIYLPNSFTSGLKCTNVLAKLLLRCW